MPVVCGVAITAVAVTTAAVIIVGTVVVSQEIVGEIVDAVAPETEVITQASTEIKEEIPKTCDQMGAKKCDPRMIDYVSGDPKKACKACNDSTYTNENEQRREEDPPYDFIDSDGFIFGTVSHWVCKTKGQKPAGTSVLCGSCCEDTVDGYALRRKCKCAPTGGW